MAQIGQVGFGKGFQAAELSGMLTEKFKNVLVHYSNFQKCLLTSSGEVPKIGRLRPALPVDTTNTSRFYHSLIAMGTSTPTGRLFQTQIVCLMISRLFSVPEQTSVGPTAMSCERHG